MPSPATPPSIFPAAAPAGSQREPQGKAAEDSSAAEAFAAALGNAVNAAAGKHSATAKTDTGAKAQAEATNAISAATDIETTDAVPTASPGIRGEGQDQRPDQSALFAALPASSQAEPADAPVTMPDPSPAAGKADPAQAERPTSGQVRADEVKADPLTARETRASEVLTRLMTEGQRTEGAKATAPEGNEARLAGLTKALDAATGKSTEKAATPKAAEAQTASPANNQTQAQGEAQLARTEDNEAQQAGVERLKGAKPASERTPGELLRSDIRHARAEAGRSVETSAAKASDAKSAISGSSASEIKSDVSASATARAANPSASIPPAIQAMPAFEFMLAGLPQGGELMLDEVALDQALSKSDTVFDPAAAKVDARAEIRTASTLQFAQGPRLTPQSAQTMAAQIAQRFNEGSRVFDIRMDPPELGRVEVRLEVGKDNSVRAVLTAERTETLAELQRSARELERALTEAGLDVGEDALSFSLSDEGSSLFDDNRSETGPNTPVFVDGESGPESFQGPLAPVSTYGFLLARAEGLDVSV